ITLKLLFGFQRPAPQPDQNLRCNQTDNLPKSISAVNNFFPDNNLFSGLPAKLPSQKGLAFYHKQFHPVKRKINSEENK
ncbi:MAG TPA: hypothetical protein VIK21_04395, partial [Desulfuromonadaceae bacterium]